jgi:predicted glycosyltransferase
VITGSPVAPYMPLPEGADLVKLPAVVKAGADRYRARDLEVSFRQIKKIRRDLILGTAEAFRPHLFMVDNVPLGMKGEVLPTLKHLRERSPSTRIVLNLRDILDDPKTIRAAWERDGVWSVLEQFYDHILVLGDRSVHDAEQAYGLPPGKTVHVGYAAPRPRQTPALRAEKSGGVRILLTAGGGSDGASLLDRAVSALDLLRRTAASSGLRDELRLK